MDLGLTLNLEQKQELVMTPQLQMAIELLQFSSQDLQEYVDEELKNNPLLERDEVDEKNDMEERIDNQYATPSYSSKVSSNDDDQMNYENFVSYQPNLIEHLENQLYQVIAEEEMELGKYIIGNIDKDGFLTLSIAEISQKFQVKREKVEEVLSEIQHLDPIGVAARNLKETLLIQLESLMLDTRLAEQIIDQHFELLGDKNYSKIIKKMDAPEEKVRGAINLIKTLNPKPAAAYNDQGKTKYISPDIVIRKVNDEFVIVINEKASPILRINPQYYRMLQRTKGEEHDFLKDKFQSALWLIKSIEQRRITVYRITEAIIKKQEDFLRKGIKYLQPMTMQDIADEIDMHESTVSRATSEKYIQTPQGLFELKFFFTSGVNNISSVSIKAMIKEYIKNEDSSSPLSDNKLSKLLKEEEGMSLSRRTVAKYRNEMNIPSSVKRKCK